MSVRCRCEHAWTQRELQEEITLNTEETKETRNGNRRSGKSMGDLACLSGFRANLKGVTLHHIPNPNRSPNPGLDIWLPGQDAVGICAGRGSSLLSGLVSGARLHRNAGERSLGHVCAGVPAGPPMLYSLDVFQALASISSVGLYTSCEALFLICHTLWYIRCFQKHVEIWRTFQAVLSIVVILWLPSMDVMCQKVTKSFLHFSCRSEICGECSNTLLVRHEHQFWPIACCCGLPIMGTEVKAVCLQVRERAEGCVYLEHIAKAHD